MVVWQATIIDVTGKPATGANIEVRDQETDVLVTIYEDEEGAVLLDNPFSNAEPFVRFYTGDGIYKITATKEGNIAEWENVRLGIFATMSDVEENLYLWKDQNDIERRLWIEDHDPDDEYDGEDGDLWFVREEES